MNTEGTMTVEELIKELNKELAEKREKARNALWLDLFCAAMARTAVGPPLAATIADRALEKAIELGRI